MSTTTTTKRAPLIAVEMFRAGVRDAIDLPEAEPCTFGPSWDRGQRIGRAVCRVRGLRRR